MVDEIPADAVVRIEEVRETQLRTDAVGAGDEHRIGETREPEETAEATDVGDHLGPACLRHPARDAAEGVLRDADVDPGVAIADPAAGHYPFTALPAAERMK